MNKKSKPANAANGSDDSKKLPQMCGLVMPISGCRDYEETHWSEVKLILTEALEEVGFSVSLVSDADDVGIIQKRIVQNLYDNPIIVCDVSGKNPNVMFELGMRLAFDKPTVIVKDDQTSYSFDTAPIEHLEYPADLHYAKIVDFKQRLGEKVRRTLQKAENDSSYTTFLKHFGKFSVATLETQEVSKEDFIIEELRELRKAVSRNERASYSERRVLKPSEFWKEHVLFPEKIFELENLIDRRVAELLSEIPSAVANGPVANLQKYVSSEIASDARLREHIMKFHPDQIDEMIKGSLRRALEKEEQ